MSKLLALIAASLALFDGEGRSTIQWQTEVIAKNRTRPEVLYSIVASGAFRGEWSADLMSVRDQWIARHPGASIVPIYVLHGEPKPDSQVVFVWIVDGDDNLALDLLRHGCFVAAHVSLPLGDISDVSVPRAYKEFLRLAKAAERSARTRKAGIWRKDSRENGK